MQSRPSPVCHQKFLNDWHYLSNISWCYLWINLVDLFHALFLLVHWHFNIDWCHKSCAFNWSGPDDYYCLALASFDVAASGDVSLWIHVLIGLQSLKSLCSQDWSASEHNFIVFLQFIVVVCRYCYGMKWHKWIHLHCYSLVDVEVTHRHCTVANMLSVILVRSQSFQLIWMDMSVNVGYWSNWIDEWNYC